MQAEHMQITPAPGMEKVEVIIREVSGLNELPIKAPLKLNITGTIGAPAAYLEQRGQQTEQFEEKRSHLLVDREEVKLTLVINENQDYTSGRITGKLEKHPMFKEFGINSEKEWTPSKLARFFKMNRAFFTSREDNMNLVAQLMNFTATVNNQIEKSANEKGDKTDKFVQTVNSNLPAGFKLLIPLFKGTQPELIEVETIAQVDGREISFTLISPAAQEVLEETRDRAIDAQLAQIMDTCPGLVIIEQ